MFTRYLMKQNKEKVNLLDTLFDVKLEIPVESRNDDNDDARLSNLSRSCC